MVSVNRMNFCQRETFRFTSTTNSGYIHPTIRVCSSEHGFLTLTLTSDKLGMGTFESDVTNLKDHS